jgi:hypothetical protein
MERQGFYYNLAGQTSDQMFREPFSNHIKIDLKHGSL